MLLSIQDTELNFLFALQNLHCNWLDPIMIFFTELGNNGIVWIGIALVCLCFKRTRRCGLLMGLTMLFCLALGNGVIKNLVARPRPFQALGDSTMLIIPPPSEYSFPSGHTMHGFASAVTILLHNRKAGIAAILGALIIAFSRMYLFVHFPTDILGGAVIGTLAALMMYALAKKVKDPAESNQRRIEE
ncbi:MAG: phosphatase PAP2 family protein [Lachnospiraceae bacterium]|nr:phosphatase PAP2 family protein [Lachnospiraceae bacterium]